MIMLPGLSSFSIPSICQENGTLKSSELGSCREMIYYLFLSEALIHKTMKGCIIDLIDIDRQLIRSFWSHKIA